MSRTVALALFFFSQFSCNREPMGVTFMLPKLFAEFGANEKDVGAMLMVTTIVHSLGSLLLRASFGPVGSA